MTIKKRYKLMYIDFNLPYLLKDSYYPVGGATIEWYSWINGFVENGHDVSVLTWKGANEFIQKDIQFELIETYNREEGIPVIRWFYKRYPAILNAIKQYNPDFLFQECACILTGILAHIGKILGIPFIYRVASDIDVDGRYKKKLPKYQQIIYRYGIKNSDVILCQNSYQYMVVKNNFPDKKILKINNPYYTNNDLPEIKKKTDRKYVAWIGNFRYAKNLPALYDIVTKLPGVEFKIAGKVLPIIDDNTKKFLELLKEKQNVELMDYIKRNEIIPFLSKAFLLLNTSHFEGFSNTFLESLSAGTPIVTINKNDPDNIISSYGLGSIPDNYSHLPDSILSVITHNQYDNLAEKCRSYVIKNHNSKLLANKVINFLSKL